MNRCSVIKSGKSERQGIVSPQNSPTTKNLNLQPFTQSNQQPTETDKYFFDSGRNGRICSDLYLGLTCRISNRHVGAKR